MGLIEMVTTGSARGQDCTGVLHFVLNRQPALRTLLLHASHAWCAAAGGGSEEVVASEAVVGEVVEALQQRYTPQMLTIERLDSLEQAEEGMSSLVRHAVEQVVLTVKAQQAYHYIYTTIYVSTIYVSADYYMFVLIVRSGAGCQWPEAKLLLLSSVRVCGR